MSGGIGRRDFLRLGGAAVVLPLLPGRAFPASPTSQPLPGLSAFGDLKYQPGFAHFDYVNPNAPKGGVFNFQPPNWLYNQNPQTFNTLNSFVTGGDAPPRMELCFDSLMRSALDEPDALYGLLAESVTISEDRNSFTFKLRPEARWHDGAPLTAEDVAFSFNLFREKGHPQLLLPLLRMTETVAEDPQTVRVAVGGVEVGDFAIDPATGIVTFAAGSIPTDGEVVTAGYEFDVPARFDAERIAISLSAFKAGQIPTIPIIEIEP